MKWWLVFLPRSCYCDAFPTPATTGGHIRALRCWSRDTQLLDSGPRGGCAWAHGLGSDTTVKHGSQAYLAKDAMHFGPHPYKCKAASCLIFFSLFNLYMLPLGPAFFLWWLAHTLSIIDSHWWDLGVKNDDTLDFSLFLMSGITNIYIL